MATALGVVLDVGVHMTPNFTEAIECVKLLLEKKFFAESKDEVALILCGSETTDNALADEEGSFQNICLAFNLAPISWKILEFLCPDLLSSTTGDVIDALMVGADHLHTCCKNKKNIKEMHLLVVSNLCGLIDDSDASRISQSLRSTGIKFSLIGCDLKNDNISPSIRHEPGPSHIVPHRIHPLQKIRPCISFLAELWDLIDGESYSFSDAVSALSIFETRSVSQRGWNADLQIGDSVFIPVVGYTHIKEAHPPTMEIMYAPDPSLPLRSVTKYHTQNGSSSDLHSSEVTRGYRYGGTVVPFGQEDLASIKSPSEKCFSVVGFTDANNVPHNVYTGDSVLVFVAKTARQSEENLINCPSSSSALIALAQALYEIGGVALVRRVYNQTSAVRLGVLTPEIRGNQISLMYTDIAFSEDIRNPELPSLPLSCKPSSSTTERYDKPSSNNMLHKYCPSAEQLSAMDSFIDSMMLSYSDASDDDNETNKEDENDVAKNSSKKVKLSILFQCYRERLFSISIYNFINIAKCSLKLQRISNPWIQRFFACLRKRGLNPSLPLPTSNVWLSPETFPGLEEIITQIGSDSETSSVIESRNILLNSFPPLRPSCESADLTEEYLAKRRRLMDEGLCPTPPFTKEICIEHEAEQPLSSLGLTSNSLNLNTSVSNSIQINSVQDFENLVYEQQIEVACRLLERQIIQLVTDPFTETLLRPKAIAYLFAYRKHAQPHNQIRDTTSNNDTHHLEIARAYNSFIRNWRQDLIDRNLLGSNVLSPHASNDSRLSFWLETITQGMWMYILFKNTFVTVSLFKYKVRLQNT
ncbi:X-ray repair cross-complementing protein isoform 2 [Schistosoma japonicum]|uniref:X-ray repair cross-complementing protein isoform 2 n=1 Tax=Schistosoma japonicum TaxID=6182 RepID=A0A4Z2DG33_SCHJA|nr:X-ray repair cross-complementing protein isoform 2 [Schistosoma japonicum]